MRVRGQALGARVRREEPVQARGEAFALDVDFEVTSAPCAEPLGRALLVVVVPPREAYGADIEKRTPGDGSTPIVSPT